MTTDELITNASPEQLREALREYTKTYPIQFEVMFRGFLTNALEGKE